MGQNETITLSQKKKAILQELRYLTYYEPCNDQYIKRIIELVQILVSDPRELIPEEFQYENFISRFYERHPINKIVT